MTEKEIVQALRCCASGESEEECPFTKKYGGDGCPKVSADRIERLTAENADLRKEIEWKDMVIALAQRKQTEAEAERDALREKQRWISATEPPKEWKDEKTGYMINYLINCVYSGVDVGSYHAEAGCWLCCGLPVTVTHWMPMPKAPEVNV